MYKYKQVYSINVHAFYTITYEYIIQFCTCTKIIIIIRKTNKVRLKLYIKDDR